MPRPCCKETWGKIPDDEPAFTLRAQDKLSRDVVEFWIHQARAHNVAHEKIAAAVEHLDDIERWQRDNPDRVKLPD